jgi:predicted acetyltransferase
MTDSAAGPYPIRPITEDEFDSFHVVDEHAFHRGSMSVGARAGSLSRFEFDRSLAAFDPDSAGPVGITSIFSFRLTVPGAAVPTAAVSWVGVLPSHRRRGVLRSLMRRQLADIRDRREPIAVLWASEASIYGRYGYGRASWHLGYTVRRGETVLTPSALSAADGLRLRLVEPSDAYAELAKVYETVLPTRPGFFARNEQWWQKALDDPEEERKGAAPLRCMLAEDDSGPRGYAAYSGVDRWTDETFLPDCTLNVRELVAADPGASAALWADLLSRDLTSEFRAVFRPVDDPLLSQLADPRRLRPVICDGLWVRLVDVPRALAARRYSAPADVVIEVRDAGLPENDGRWRLTTTGGAADGLAATCERTGDPADLALDVAELGGAYLGGTRLGALAVAGLVEESRPGAVRQLSAAMAWDPAPWCPLVF